MRYHIFMVEVLNPLDQQVGSVFNIILNIPLMKFWGLYGAMVSTVLSEVLVTGYQFWTIRNEVEFARIFTN